MKTGWTHTDEHVRTILEVQAQHPMSMEAGYLIKKIFGCDI